jgi:hypothetical protein
VLHRFEWGRGNSSGKVARRGSGLVQGRRRGGRRACGLVSLLGCLGVSGLPYGPENKKKKEN